MENNKDIGKAIREKLSDFDQSPDDKLWLKIEADLGKNKKRRILPFWFLFAGLMLVSGIGWIYQFSSSDMPAGGHENVSGQSVSDVNDPQAKGKNEAGLSVGKTSDEKRLMDNPITEKSLVEKSVYKKSSVVNDEKNLTDKNPADLQKKPTGKMSAKGSENPGISWIKSGKTKPGNTKSVRNKKSDTVQIPEFSSTPDHESHTGIAAKANEQTRANETSKRDRAPFQAQENPNDLAKTDSLNTAENKKGKKTELSAAIEKIAEKLDIFVYASPTYAGNFSNASPLDRRLNGNHKTSEVKFGLGAYCVYETDQRWSLRFGLALVNLRYITENATVNATDYSYIAYSGINNAMIYAQSGDTSMDIIQDVSYLEIPLGFKYVLRPARFGVNLYGGISYMLLTQNEVSARTASGMHYELGKTETLSDNTFTVNAGIGFDYKLGKQVRLNFEPVFKLHLFDYKNLDARPYSIGVLAGLQFSLK